MGEAGEDGLRAAALSVARFSSMYEWTRCDRVIDYDAYVCLRATMTVAVAVRHRVGGPRSARAAASQKMPPPPPPPFPPPSPPEWFFIWGEGFLLHLGIRKRTTIKKHGAA